MKLKYKTMMIFFFSVMVLIGATYLIFYAVFTDYVNMDNKNRMKTDFEKVTVIIDNEKSNLETILKDWAYWDDTYQFVGDRNQNFINLNLNQGSIENLDVNMVLIASQNGEVIGVGNSGLTSEASAALVENLKQHNFYRDMLTEKEDTQTSLIMVAEKPYLVSRGWVNNSTHTASSKGTIVVIKAFDKGMADYIATITGVNVELEDGGRLGDFPENEVITRKFNGKFFLTASQFIKDTEDGESILMTLSREEDNYNLIQSRFDWFIFSYVLLIVLILIIDFALFNRFFFSRIKKLIDFVKEVGVTGDTTLSIKLEGKDELNELAVSTNKMLLEINRANQDLKMMDERYRLIMEATNDGYLDIWVKQQEAYISQEWKQLIGYRGTDGHQLFQEYFSKIHWDCKKRVENNLADLFCGKVDYFEEEYRVISELYGVIWVSHRGKVVQREEDNQAIRFISTLSNITRRKINEEEILFLSYSDPLTRLRNRDYMKKQFDVLSQEKDSHYFIMMCDINGLKLTNDAFGHQEGDRILVAVSNVLRRMCKATDIISRWPGDEFVVVLKERTQEEVCRLIRDINEEMKKVQSFHLNISVAIGYAESSPELKGPEAVLNLAESRMYRNKLMESASSRNATIRSLARSLHEKSTETEAHTMRIKNLSNAIGNRLNLRKDQMDELELLSLLHDIGKIGIPEYVLEKPSELTAEEWGIIKTHPEIGYRIAKSTPALEHIAEEILAHHEKYDGTGYPKGLKGAEIPYLGRIINVVDSFDVMTHSRGYKKANDLTYAVSELKRCAGTQFDPAIVAVFLAMIEDESLPVDLEISINQ